MLIIMNYLTNNKSNGTLPSKLIDLFSRRPSCLLCNTRSLITDFIFFIRPRKLKFLTLRCCARLIKYGKSKLFMLYPVKMSGSNCRTKSAHFL